MSSFLSQINFAWLGVDEGSDHSAVVDDPVDLKLKLGLVLGGVDVSIL